MTKDDLTQSQLKELLHYDPNTGIFTWLDSYRNNGKQAGTVRPDGYRQINIRGWLCLAHRLAWFHFYGVWPDEVDHINHDKDDNSVNNMRDVDHATNQQNTKKPFEIYWDKRDKRYVVRKQIYGKRVVFGRFKTSEECEQFRRPA